MTLTCEVVWSLKVKTTVDSLSPYHFFWTLNLWISDLSSGRRKKTYSTYQNSFNLLNKLGTKGTYPLLSLVRWKECPNNVLSLFFPTIITTIIIVTSRVSLIMQTKRGLAFVPKSFMPIPKSRKRTKPFTMVTSILSMAGPTT